MHFCALVDRFGGLMPEGHTIHRMAQDHGRWLGGQSLRVLSPQGRFSAEARILDYGLFVGAFAHGKHLFYQIEDREEKTRFVHIHLGLYGRFRKQQNPPERTSPNCRMRLVGFKHALDLSGPTACELMGWEEIDEKRHSLGPDPIAHGDGHEAFFERLQRRRIPIGAALLDQKVIAGLGNIYRAELLFKHRIDPSIPANQLSEASVKQLWETSVWWLKLGVRAKRIITSLPSMPKTLPRGARKEFLMVYGKRNCPACGGAVEQNQIGNRKLYFCPSCQTGQR